MSNINFTCPHCSFQKQLPASAEGMQGNCPSCKAVVTIRADAPANPQISPQQPLPQQPLPQQPLPQQPLPQQPLPQQQQSANPNLLQCKDCGSMISRNATTCPHCGTPNPSASEGTLVVSRNKRMLFALGKMNVWLNGNLLATLKNGEATRTNLPAGKHTLRIGHKNFAQHKLTENEVQVNIEGGKVTRVEFDATTTVDRLDYSISNPT
jgi:hypothetical protein